MLLAEFIKELACGASAPCGHVFEALADGFFFIAKGGEVEEALVGGGVLDDSFGFAVDGEDDGSAGLLKALHHFDGVVAEGGEGLDVLGDVDHGGLRLGGILSYLNRPPKLVVGHSLTCRLSIWKGSEVFRDCCV
jgi:hypothetical protein